MTTNDRTIPTRDTWQSRERGPALASCPAPPPGPVTVIPHHCPDAGTFYRVMLGGVVEVGHSPHPALAETQAAAVRRALATTEGTGACYERARALRDTPGDLDVLCRWAATPTSAALRVLGWVLTGVGPLGATGTEGEEEAEPREPLTLDRAMVSEDVGGAE